MVDFGEEGCFLRKYSLMVSVFLACFSTISYGIAAEISENGSNAYAVHQMGYTGTGVNVGMIAGRNVRATHLAFNDADGINSRVFNSDYSHSGIDYDGGSCPGHDTWCAGIVAGGYFWDGHPNDIGVAPNCNLYSARVANDNNYIGSSTEYFVHTALKNLIGDDDCTVIVAPMALGGDADGNSVHSMMIDYFAYANPYVVFALASGNNGDNPSVFGDAYNGITTAALIDVPDDIYIEVGNYSNPGPTSDGRNKPDVSAPGSSQTTPSIGSDVAAYTTAKNGATSFSVPQTAGVATLMQDYIANAPDIDAEATRSVVIKAVMVNTTFPNINGENGIITYPADVNNTWHFDRGYGRIDALRAIQTLSGERVFNSDSYTITSPKGWSWDSLAGEDMHMYKISGNYGDRLIVTVTWNRAVECQEFQRKYPVYSIGEEFNLDLIIRDSAGQVVRENLGSADNLEKIDISLSADDVYTVELINTTSNSRDYGFAFEVLPPLAGDLNIDYAVDVFDLAYMSDGWLTGSGSDKIDMVALAEVCGNWMAVDEMYHNE